MSVHESVKLIHFNDNRPEYKNIMITNLKDNLAYIFDGNKFITIQKNIILNDLFNHHLENIENYINSDNIIEKSRTNKNLYNIINDKKLDRFFKEIKGDEIHSDYKDYKSHKINELKLLIYNSTNTKQLELLKSHNLKEKIIN